MGYGKSYYNCTPAEENLFRSFSGEDPRPIVEQNRCLVIENERLRAEMGAREEAAYRHGLGDRALVLDQNRVLAATVAALTDPLHALNLRRR